MDTKEMTELIAKTLSDKKAEDITIINVEEMTILTDAYIICNAKSSTAVKALAEYVEEALSKEGVEPLHRDGIRDGQWGVLDYGGVIVHIFQNDVRQQYGLEKIWSNKENTVRYQG